MFATDQSVRARIQSKNEADEPVGLGNNKFQNQSLRSATPRGNGKTKVQCSLCLLAVVLATLWYIYVSFYVSNLFPTGDSVVEEVENTWYTTDGYKVVQFGSNEKSKPTPKFVEFFNDKAVKQSAPISDCKVVHTFWGSDQVCCAAVRANNVRENKIQRRFCLPNIVVVGAQKGGTTALHSYLMKHPNLNPSNKKELHIFDFNFSWKRYITTLVQAFRGKSDNDPHIVHNRSSFESTPSYTASPDACKRMSEYLPESTRFVLILRDPVKRAWSEVQMKERRVASQTQFIKELEQCGFVVEECINKKLSTEHNGRVPVEMKMRSPTQDLLRTKAWLQSCFRGSRCEHISTHPKFNTFIKFFVRGGPKMLKTVKNKCFSEKDEKVNGETSCWDGLNVFREKSIPVPQTFIDEAKYPQMQNCVKGLTLRRLLAQEKGTEIKLLHGKSLGVNDCWMKQYEDACLYCVDTNDVVDCTLTCIKKVHFDESQCKLKGKQPLQNNRNGAPMECRGPWCSCFPNVRMPSDISRGFLWRGMYYPQIENCIRHIPPERIVIVENEELRNAPNETLNKICRAVGVPEYNFGQHSYKEIHESFDNIYPKFETVTGWTNDGSASVHMDKETLNVLKQFYREPNQHLFRFLGKSYDWL